MPQDEVEALELARDLGAQVATELPTVAGPELAQRLGPFPAPEPFDLPDAVQRQQAPDAVGVAGLLGGELGAFAGEALGVLLLG